ncbi:thioredoxin family protein (plasmid) [Fulvitalea axinellae]|uniref:Thioredoxin family protein n=1 Tax=Fulvitalea axinellae TaxID=1182444 RepID=A0AAU9CU84_9BACT|nr:thioredoxin family protein [Fulvitalea axinellae]
MEIMVLGPGCPKCKKLEEATNQAVAQSETQVNVTKVEDIMKIMEYGIMSTPALVIDGEVVMKGRVPSVNELAELITSKK